MPAKKAKISTLRLFAFVAVVAFTVNLCWELAHSALYDWNIPPLESDVRYYIGRIVLSTAGDSFFIVLICALMSFIKGGVGWVNGPSKKDAVMLALMGLLASAAIETRAMLLNRWTYNELMPMIFGLGLTPLVQLAATALITVKLAAIWSGKK